MASGLHLSEILALCERLGIEIRQAHLGGNGGGLCVFGGKQVVFVDLDADSATQIERCITGLAALPDLGGIYVHPAIREAIEIARHAASG